MDELKKYGDNIVINDYEISVLSKCNRSEERRVGKGV